MTYEVRSTEGQALLHDAARPWAVVMIQSTSRRETIMSRHATRELAMKAASRRRNMTQVR
jgi:hypothetical protein